MRFYFLVLAVLALWRTTHLLAAEDGPWDLVVRLRRRAGDGFWGRLLDCFYCLSLWLAAPLALALGEGWGERLLLWPALSAGAILLERATAPREPAPELPVYYREEPIDEEEEDHELLRRTQTSPGGEAADAITTDSPAGAPAAPERSPRPVATAGGRIVPLSRDQQPGGGGPAVA